MNKKSRALFNAVISCNWGVIDKFLEDGGDIDASLVSTGRKTGYTVLHLTAMKGKTEHVEKLIRAYEANVNSVGADGAQPIHLACLFDNLGAVEILLKCGANVDAVITKNVFEKYKSRLPKQKWSDNFGSTITLLTFGVINSHYHLLRLLLEKNPNVRIKDTNNRTLVMYITKYDVNDSPNQCIVHLILSNGWFRFYPGLMNARDNNNWHAFHHLLLNDNFRKIPMRRMGRITCNTVEFIAMKLIKAGADVNVMIDNDPNTLPINLIAYMGCNCSLLKLLHLDVPLSVEAKPLHYATLNVDRKNKYLRILFDDDIPIEKLKRHSNECPELILQSFYLRRVFGMFVPKEEIKLMDKILVEDPKMMKIVSDFKDLTNGRLKKEMIRYGDESITVYDLAVKVFNAKSLKVLVKNDTLMKACLQSLASGWRYFCYNLHIALKNEITRAYERKKLIEKVQKVPQLRKYIPLPYEIILDIIDYLDNANLKKFTYAFCKINCPYVLWKVI